jgi:hypothetical protein
MGRFYLRDDTDVDEVDEGVPCRQEDGYRCRYDRRNRCSELFSANKGEAGAMVSYSTHTASVHSALSDRDNDSKNRHSRLRGNGWSRDPFSQGIATSDHWDYWEGEKLAPIHRQPRGYASYFLISSAIIVLVALAAHKELPPAPPYPPGSHSIPWTSPSTSSPDFDDYYSRAGGGASWKDYAWAHSAQLIQSFSALFLQTPRHVASWWWRAIYTDVQIWFEQHHPCSKEQCSLHHYDNVLSLLRTSLVGQDQAIEVVSNALDTWLRSKWQFSVPTGDKTSTRNRPLLLFFTGFYSVGKTTLTKALVRRALFPKDCSNPQRSLLELSGGDFGGNDDQDVLRAELMRRIVRHVQKYSKGSVVIIQDIQEMQPSLFCWLVKTLSEPMEQPLADTTTHIYGDISVECANAIFVFTSSAIGRNAIARVLRQTGGNMLLASLSADLVHEVDRYFGDLDSQSLVNFVIVPFGPLTKRHLCDILRLRMEQLVSTTWASDLLIADSAIELLLGANHVEYWEWKRLDHSDTEPVVFLSVSLKGAQVLDQKRSPFWSDMVLQFHRCASKRAPTNAMTAAVDFRYDHVVVLRCASGFFRIA